MRAYALRTANIFPMHRSSGKKLIPRQLTRIEIRDNVLKLQVVYDWREGSSLNQM